MSRTFEVQLSYEDYLAANWLRIRRRWWWRGLARHFAITIPLYTFIFGLGTLTAGNLTLSRALVVIAQGTFWSVAVLALLVLYWLWCIPRQAGKIWVEQPLMKLAGQFDFDSSGFRSATERESHDLLWTHISGWVENNRMFIIGKSRSTFFVIPKSQVALEIVDALRAALTAAKVSKR